MCGIAGFLGDFKADMLFQMIASIAHRGPDDLGYEWQPDRGLGLGHTRLSIIDLSPAGRQPMWDSAGRHCIVFNGEIYNYRELRKELSADGHRFHSTSDTEVLLHLYQRMGPDMLSRLNGIFAFALWDDEKREMVVARDGMGVKPFYFTSSSRGFAFASELKALTIPGFAGREIDTDAISYYLTFLWAPAPSTPLREVRKLEPGYAMIVDSEGIRRTWCHYDLPYGRDKEITSEEMLTSELKRTLAQSVEQQMVSDVPVGAFLSGGLDSSAVVSYARNSSPDGNIQCFTIASDYQESRRDGRTEDLPYARQVADHLDVGLEVVPVVSDMMKDLDWMLYHLEEPQPDLAALNVGYIAGRAREAGYKVLLSGAGGDDLFTGYRRHRALLLERWWQWLPRGARRHISQITSTLPKSTPIWRRLAKAFQYMHLDGDRRLVSYFYWLDPQRVNELFSPEASPGTASPGEVLLTSLGRLPADADPLDRMLYLDAKHFLTDHNLNYTDKLSMASGVEVRVPILSPAMVDLASRVPDGLKQKGGTGKYIFKRAMEGILPREVIYRPKGGFGVPLRSWIRGPLRGMVDETLSRENLANRGLFDVERVRALVEADRAGQVDGAFTILSLICIERWARLFVDATTRPSDSSIRAIADRPMASQRTSTI